MKHPSLVQSRMATIVVVILLLFIMAACRHMGRSSKLVASESAQNMARRHNGYAARVDAYVGDGTFDVLWVLLLVLSGGVLVASVLT